MMSYIKSSIGMIAEMVVLISSIILILTILKERIRSKRPELWENHSWILYRENMLGHNALSVNQFLIKSRNRVIQYCLYFLDIIFCDFWLFLKFQNVSNKTHFESVESVKI